MINDHLCGHHHHLHHHGQVKRPHQHHIHPVPTSTLWSPRHTDRWQLWRQRKLVSLRRSWTHQCIFKGRVSQCFYSSIGSHGPHRSQKFSLNSGKWRAIIWVKGVGVFWNLYGFEIWWEYPPIPSLRFASAGPQKLVTLLRWHLISYVMMLEFIDTLLCRCFGFLENLKNSEKALFWVQSQIDMGGKNVVRRQEEVYPILFGSPASGPLT